MYSVSKLDCEDRCATSEMRGLQMYSASRLDCEDRFVTSDDWCMICTIR